MQWYVVVSPGSFPSQWYRYAVPSTPWCVWCCEILLSAMLYTCLRLAKNVIFIDLYFHWTVVSYMECTQRVTLVPFTDSNEYFFFLRRSSSSSSYFLSPILLLPIFVSLVFLVGRLAWQQIRVEEQKYIIYNNNNNNATSLHVVRIIMKEILLRHSLSRAAIPSRKHQPTSNTTASVNPEEVPGKVLCNFSRSRRNSRIGNQ